MTQLTKDLTDTILETASDNKKILTLLEGDKLARKKGLIDEVDKNTADIKATFKSVSTMTSKLKKIEEKQKGFIYKLMGGTLLGGVGGAGAATTGKITGLLGKLLAAIS